METNDVVFKRGTASTGERFTLAIAGTIKDTAKVSISVCSSKNQFAKKKGRHIASGRLLKNKHVRNFVVKDGQTPRETIASITDSMNSKSKTEILSVFSLGKRT